MKSFISLFLLLCLLSGVVSAAEWSPVTITDDSGYTSEIASEPQTIVSLGPSNTEILFALGLGDKITGVTEYCDYPAEAHIKPIVGGISSVNIEKIVVLHPDIIFANAMIGEGSIHHLRQLGYTVICPNPKSEGTFSSIRRVGSATGTSAVAEDLIASMQQRINAAAGMLETVGAGMLTVTHIVGTDPYWVSGVHTFQDELITLAGGKNAFSEIDGWGIISLEHLLTTDPDVILIDSDTGMGEMGKNLLKQSFMTDPHLSSLSAVKNNRVYIVDSDTFDRGGLRIGDALDELIAALYPAVSTASAEAAASPRASGFGILPVVFGVVLGLMLARR
ncbi:MAG: ABC transporter substrate-binding protein [Methanocalculaceae archaeon]|jgi:iron complex transport system substrate-binding protein|nr:ABC transporter substrate-binding protein [Methanocalculaceae archaeon]